jgi:high affinity Mn2+ porin
LWFVCDRLGSYQYIQFEAEKIIEMYYSLPIFSWRVTFDYQFITNPAYNRDRGPVSVIGARLRAQF